MTPPSCRWNDGAVAKLKEQRQELEQKLQVCAHWSI